jgi:hypothetical protein
MFSAVTKAIQISVVRVIRIDMKAKQLRIYEDDVAICFSNSVNSFCEIQSALYKRNEKMYSLSHTRLGQ